MFMSTFLYEEPLKSDPQKSKISNKFFDKLKITKHLGGETY